MKHSKLVSLLLALVLAVSFAAVPALAADEPAGDETLTRGEFVSALFAQSDAEEMEPRQAYFEDVPMHGELALAIRWAVGSGVVKGYGNSKFGPDDPVTREQMATMLYRRAQALGKGFEGAWMFPLNYPDAAEISDWANEAMHWVVMNEVIVGTDKGLEPKALATDDQLALVLQRWKNAISDSAKGKWIADGYFADDNGHTLSIVWMDDVDEPGWYVSFFGGGDPIADSYSGMLLPEEISLKGVLSSGGDKAPMTVTITETGAAGLRFAVDGGETYVFLPMEIEAPACTVTINTEGIGRVAYAAEGEELNLDGEERYTSHTFPLSEPAKITIGAKADEDGWYFVKWTKNGEDYTTDEIFTAEIAEDAEFVAVFAAAADDGQNPVMNFIGEYQCDRAHALVECIGDDGAQITIEWGSSAWELARWVIIGRLDTDTLTVAYSACTKSIVTYDESGALVSEEAEYEDGTGTIVFSDDLKFTWHEDQAERDDMVFEWLPAAEN